MSDEPYSARVRALFAKPAHAGVIGKGASIRVDDQDLSIALSAEVESGRISALRFKAFACPHVIAAAEQACAELEGRPVAALLEFSAADLMQSLAVPVEKTGRILVLQDAVVALGRKIAEVE